MIDFHIMKISVTFKYHEILLAGRIFPKLWVRKFQRFQIGKDKPAMAYQRYGYGEGPVLRIKTGGAWNIIPLKTAEAYRVSLLYTGNSKVIPAERNCFYNEIDAGG